MKVTVKFDLEDRRDELAHDILTNRLNIMRALSEVYEFTKENNLKNALKAHGILDLFYDYRWVFESIEPPWGNFDCDDCNQLKEAEDTGNTQKAKASDESKDKAISIMSEHINKGKGKKK